MDELELCARNSVSNKSLCNCGRQYKFQSGRCPEKHNLNTKISSKSVHLIVDLPPYRLALSDHPWLALPFKLKLHFDLGRVGISLPAFTKPLKNG
jgi:hypothetical protein